MRFFASFFAFVFNCLLVLSQISHGGYPVGLGPVSKSELFLHREVLPEIRPQLKSNVLNESGIRHKSLVFAQAFESDLSPENSGTWSISVDGSKVWHLSVFSQGAKTLNIVFSEYELQPGATLFIYNPEMTQVFGGFTSENNKASGILPTMPVIGENLIVELRLPPGVNYKSKLTIGTINHDFLGVHAFLQNTSPGFFGSSEFCEVDASCVDGMEEQKQSVVKIIVNGVELCTGTLVNNTRQDGTPYILTAAHSFMNHGFKAEGALFIFNYQVPGCFTTIEGSREQSVAGGVMRAYSETNEFLNSDYALVELSVSPPASYMPFYAGWNAQSTLDSAVTAIHHPSGDVKKLSFDRQVITPTTLIVQGYYYKSNSHWLIRRWDSGVTEGGSSGCPIFSKDGLVLGSLSAGEADCSNPVNDYFFTLSRIWTSHTNVNKTLKFWLDPVNSGATRIEGFYPDKYDNIQRVSNVAKGEGVGVTRLPSGGYQSGHNTIGVTRFAEKFSLADTCRLYGFYFVPFKGTSTSAGMIEFKVWKGINTPEKVIWSKKVSIKEWLRTQSVPTTLYGRTGGYSTKSVYSNKENFVSISEEVYPGSTFFVGYELLDIGPVDTFAMLQVKDRNPEMKNTAWFFGQNTWKPFTEYSWQPTNTSLFFDVVVKTFNISSDTTIPGEKKRIVTAIRSSVATQVRFVFANDITDVINIDIYDARGALVSSHKAFAGAVGFDLDMHSLSGGIYFARFRYDGMSETHRVWNYSR
jgi:lysyl endopeptidase